MNSRKTRDEFFLFGSLFPKKKNDGGVSMDRKAAPRRDGAVDLVKSLAICAVLLIHCSASHFANYGVGSNRWLAAAFYGSVSRWAVPAFQQRS